MRHVAIAAVAALAIGFAGTRPASAAWQCMGPEASCISAKTGHKASKAKSAYAKGQKAKHRVASHKTKKSYSSVASSSYSGGGGSTGIASYYSSGTRTASGARFNPGGMTAAHRSLPFGTRVLVTSLATGRSVTVTINDRGPFVKGRIIDLSHGAASALGITGAGLARVQVAVVN